MATYTIYPLAPPLISFNGGRPSGEYSVDNLRKLTKVQAKTDPSFIYDLQYQIKSCKVSWQKQDGTGVTKTLKRGGFKPIQTVLSNARPGQIFTFTNMKVNVFENKKKVDEQSIKTSLSITILFSRKIFKNSVSNRRQRFVFVSLKPQKKLTVLKSRFNFDVSLTLLIVKLIFCFSKVLTK